MYATSTIGYVNNITTSSFSLKSSVETYMQSLTECIWNFQNDALWDTHSTTSEVITTAL